MDVDCVGCDLYIVPESLRRRALLQKRFKLREKIGTIGIDLDRDDEEGNYGSDVEDFDEIEQIYHSKISSCKYKYMYGGQDMKDLKVFQLTSKSLGVESKSILIEIPQFQNYLMYNLLSVEILDVFKPSKTHLFVESNASNTDEIEDSNKIMTDLRTGRYRGAGGEIGLRGIAASFINRLQSPSHGHDARYDFVVLPRDFDSLSTIYL